MHHHGETIKIMNILWWNKERALNSQKIRAKNTSVEPRWTQPKTNIRPWGYKAWVHSQTQNKAQWLAVCGHVSASSQSSRFILSLSLYSSFITSRPGTDPPMKVLCHCRHRVRSLTREFHAFLITKRRFPRSAWQAKLKLPHRNANLNLISIFCNSILTLSNSISCILHNTQGIVLKFSHMMWIIWTFVWQQNNE